MLCLFHPPQLEFAVQMTCESCADKVRAALEGKPGESAFTCLPVVCKELLSAACIHSLKQTVTAGVVLCN